MPGSEKIKQNASAEFSELQPWISARETPVAASCSSLDADLLSRLSELNEVCACDHEWLEPLSASVMLEAGIWVMLSGALWILTVVYL